MEKIFRARFCHGQTFRNILKALRNIFWSSEIKPPIFTTKNRIEPWSSPSPWYGFVVRWQWGRRRPSLNFCVLTAAISIGRGGIFQEVLKCRKTIRNQIGPKCYSLGAVRILLAKDGKLFRRRFRTPYPLFVEIVEAVRKKNWFPEVDCTGAPSAPFELKILKYLESLGGECASTE